MSNEPLKSRGLPSSIMAVGMVATVIGLGVIVGRGLLSIAEEPPLQELGYRSEPEFIDFTGRLRYGKDKATGLCFANIRTADSDPRLWRTLAYIPCKALERLK